MKYRKCIVLDSSAVFHIRDLTILYSLQESARIYITNYVLNEIKDPRSEAVISILQPTIVEINTREIERAREQYRNLSDADISVVLCAKKLSEVCEEVTVLTDDSELAKLLSRLGFKVQKIFFPRRRLYR